MLKFEICPKSLPYLIRVRENSSVAPQLLPLLFIGVSTSWVLGVSCGFNHHQTQGSATPSGGHTSANTLTHTHEGLLASQTKKGQPSWNTSRRSTSGFFCAEARVGGQRFKGEQGWVKKKSVEKSVYEIPRQKAKKGGFGKRIENEEGKRSTSWYHL